MHLIHLMCLLEEQLKLVAQTYIANVNIGVMVHILYPRFNE